MVAPKISVLMSCFNAASFLTEAVESILNQTFREFEFIIIDDGSMDNTANMIKQYAALDDRIVFLQKGNTGLTDSLNVGISAARGTWIARMDADDVALPNRLEEQLSFVRAAPDVVLVGTDFLEVDDSGKVIKIHRHPSRHHGLLRNLRRTKRFFAHSSAMFRADVAQAVGGYRRRYVRTQDWDLWLRLAEQGQIACLNKPLVKIRKHSHSISRSGDGKIGPTYALAATVCHFLRSKGAGDPSLSQLDEDWHNFLSWIALRMEQDGFFERREKWSQLRVAYYSTDSRLVGAWKLFKGLAASTDSLRVLKEKWLGSDLPALLACEWIKDGVTPVQWTV